MKFLVGIWSRNNIQHMTKGNIFRISQLREACRTLQEKVNEENYEKIDSSPRFDSILTLPEYYFTRARDHESAARAMPEDEKDLLILELKKISLDYPRMLLIPGTIAFRKPFIRPLSKMLKRGGGLKNLSRNEKLVERLQTDFLNTTFAQEHRGNKNAINLGASDQLYWLYYALQWIGGDLAKLNHFHIYQNKAYVLLNGQPIFTYEKRVGFFELEGVTTENQFYAPDSRRNNCIYIGGKKFCFEICFDHHKGVAKLYTDYEKSRAATSLHSNGAGTVDISPDFHIVLSDWVPTEKEHIVTKPGGYFIHASSMASESTVIQNGGNGSTTVTPLPITNLDGSPLSIYKVG
ncbi:hypothetical protein [Xanthomonas arboricola]|uniref:hypothetical protein n=1 Tax=Xanthomonas arboricola TaxID=56448 RepID=UPI0011AFF4C9|nr:hypothetical protein [Xanthomonas arboricola]